MSLQQEESKCVCKQTGQNERHRGPATPYTSRERRRQALSSAGLLQTLRSRLRALGRVPSHSVTMCIAGGKRSMRQASRLRPQIAPPCPSPDGRFPGPRIQRTWRQLVPKALASHLEMNRGRETPGGGRGCSPGELRNSERSSHRVSTEIPSFTLNAHPSVFKNR